MRIRPVPAPHHDVPDGSGPAGLAGDVDLMFIPIGVARPQIQAGRFVALAVGGAPEHPLLPGVPTVAGRDQDFAAGTGPVLVAPSGLPATVAERLAADTSRLLAADLERYQGVVRTAGVRPD